MKYMQNSFIKQLFVVLALVLIIGGVVWAVHRPEEHRPLGQPLTRFDERPKLLTFGLYVTPDPDTNPIDPPERFTGYHTALDLEIFEEELNQTVQVNAICDGRILRAETAEGYGGVMVQSCKLDGQDVTVLYGHVEPASFAKKINETVRTGEKLAELANENSPGSGLTRKHLHLGVHKGNEVDLLGYVQTAQELENFIDPLPLIGP
jgi:hypothetical protein